MSVGEEDAIVRTGTPTVRSPSIRAVTVEARGETFKIVQLAGMLLVCARQHGSCCCGWDEKGRMPFETTLWGDEWERRKIRNRLHLTFTGCLGPCAVGNSALLQIHGRSIWFKDLNEDTLVSTVFDYIESMLACGTTLPPPPELAAHVYERFSPPANDATSSTVRASADTPADDGLDGLDPVCLMSVDPLTARYTAEHEGRTIAFCALSCKRAFVADSAAYLSS
jgi:YHS domain-containing protein